MIRRRGVTLIIRVMAGIVALWLIMAHLGPMLALIVIIAITARLGRN